VAIVDSPEVRALEPIGGTGDTLTGIAAALVFSGYRVPEAATVAARANRLAGALADPTPASQVVQLIEKIPEALETALKEAPREQDEAQVVNKHP
jgi:NAD(P)H-hydrate repair Nnr-like enzyme with NAD(P)H-hydrate dehydratase domain